MSLNLFKKIRKEGMIQHNFDINSIMYTTSS
jgi:hypothetical protein